MKSKRVKRGIAALTATLIMGIAFAFNMPTLSGKLDDSGDWYFNGSDLSEVTTVTEWSRVLEEDYRCAGNENIPCKVTVPSNTTLEQFLSDHESNIMSVASRRSEAP